MEPISQNFELEKSATKRELDVSSERPSYTSLSHRSQSSVFINSNNDGDDIISPTSLSVINHAAAVAAATAASKRKRLGSKKEPSTEGDEVKSDALSMPSNVPEKKKVSQHTQPRYHDRSEIGKKLKEELSKYKQELKEYNETTKDLEEKYMKINFELNEMQQKHNHFVANRSRNADETDTTNCESTTSIVSGVSEKPKCIGIYGRHNSFMTVLSGRTSRDDDDRELKKFCNSNKASGGQYNKMSPNSVMKVNNSNNNNNNSNNISSNNFGTQVDYGNNNNNNNKRATPLTTTLKQKRTKTRRSTDDQENNPPNENMPGLKDVYNVLKDVINTTQQKTKLDNDGGQLDQLYTAISTLKNEQVQYRYIIKQQQDCINDYHTRCVKAQEIMKTQKKEIEKLNTNNKQLESSIYSDIDHLRAKIDVKLKNVSHLPQLMRDEQQKYEKAIRENIMLAEKLHKMQTEGTQLKVRIDELGRRKLVTINRLKAAERDLKIFKNYNSALKTEKRRITDELTKVKEQLESLQSVNKRQLARHRDQSEKQRRDLQKRIFELELKLSRSQNSTSSLIQERDSLIAELQTQLHTLVHNFEVSQKHIRVLRRHIYSMTSASNSNPLGGASNAPSVNNSGGGGGSGGGTGSGSNNAATNSGGSNNSNNNKLLYRGSSSLRLNTTRTMKTPIQIKT